MIDIRLDASRVHKNQGMSYQHYFLIILLSTSLATAQTKVDLSSQSRQVDFSSASFTRPVKLGTTLPASCTLGDLFFKSDAPVGANLFGCVNSDVWAVQTGGVGLPSQAEGAFRLLTTDGINASWVLLGGDVSGSPTALIVSRIQNRNVSDLAPLPGQALVWNGASWAPGGTAAGNVGIAVNGEALATRSFINYIAGPGLINTFTDTGTQVNLQQSLDTALILTRAEHQSGSTLTCLSVGSSTTSYTCDLQPPPQQYTKGMAIFWQPNTNGSGGATTLALNNLPAQPVKLADGMTDPRSDDLRSGAVYPLWYDGAVFRMITVQPSRSGESSARPTCDATQRGQFWLTTAAAGVADELAVCAKAGDDSFSWRNITLN